jgi:hypothetical protein
MKENEIHSELASIRSLMERSAKFISLNGLSGVMAGIYALIGAFFASEIIESDYDSFHLKDFTADETQALWSLCLIASAVLIISLLTALWLTIRKAKKRNERVWNPVSRRFMVNMSIPLLTGGLLIIILILRAEYAIIAPVSLIFYGLALVSGSHYTFSDVKWLGLCEIILGLFTALMPGYALITWVLGFGLLHIVYGSVMHFKYDR